MSEDSSSSNSTRGELETSRGTARQLASLSPVSSGGRSEGVREGGRSRCCINCSPDALLASILRFIPERERIQVASLVCKQWLNLIRSRICQADITIHIFPSLLVHLQRLPPATQRVAIRSLANFGQHAKLLIKLPSPVVLSRHRGPSPLSILQAVLRELHNVRAINISIGCPREARLLAVTFAGVLRRSANTLETLEIWGVDLADATRAVLLSASPPLWESFHPQRTQAAEAFQSAAAALEASVSSHRLRTDCCSRRRKETETCRSMLTATAQILRHRIKPPPLPSWTHRGVQVEANSNQRERQQPAQRCGSRRDKDGEYFPRTSGEGQSTWPRWDAASWRDRRREATSRRELRRSLTDIENCCCCRTAAETAFRLRYSFQNVRLLLPRLKIFGVGSWKLLPVVHCPLVEELSLGTSSSPRPRSAGCRQQHQQQQFSQLPQAPAEGPVDFSRLVGTTRVDGPPVYTSSALQDLLLFLLRCGSNLRQLHGSYCVEAFNEALLQPLCAAGAALCGPNDTTIRTAAAVDSASSSAAASLLAPAPAASSTSDTRRRRKDDPFVAAAMAAVDATVEKPTCLYGTCPASTPLRASAAVRTALNGSRSSFGSLSRPQLPALCPAAQTAFWGGSGTESTFTSFKALEADQAAEAKAATLQLEEGDSVVAAAAALCASMGDGCLHRRHLRGGCCAVPCAWGSGGDLLLVLLPRLRVAKLQDFLLLGLLLLPRLEELRLPDTWNSGPSHPTPGFALLWAYLSAYGGSLRALETKGTAPPLAAFLGAGTTADPLPSNVRPDEAVATKALRLLLRVHRTHPLMDPAFSSVERVAEELRSRTLTTAATVAPVPVTSCRFASLSTDTTSDFCSVRGPLRHEQQLQQPLEGGWQHCGECTRAAASEVGGCWGKEAERVTRERGCFMYLEARDSTGALRTENRKVLYGLKFGQLQQLQCHSSFLPYLTEPVPQCGALKELNTEGDSDEVMWFVALLKGIFRICVRDPCRTVQHRRPRVGEGPLYADGEVSSGSGSNNRQLVTLAIRDYVGTAFFFGPHMRCPNLRQMQVQRGDDDFDSFLVGGGAPNLLTLRYQGHLFGGKGVSTPRIRVTSDEVRILHGSEVGENRTQHRQQLSDPPRPLSPLKLSPFASLKELHVWTLDARVVVRLAFATAAAANPRLSRAWQLVLRRRKEERQLQLRRRQQLLAHQRQVLREQESMRLLLRLRRLYEVYRTRRRRRRRLCTAVATEQQQQQQQRPSAPLQRPSSPDETSEAPNRMTRELNIMRRQLQQLQRRLEALAIGYTASADASRSRKQQQQQQRDQHSARDLERFCRLRSHYQRFVALRRLLQINVASTPSYALEAVEGGNQLRRVDESEVRRRRVRQQQGRDRDFGCSRSWCFWACHRAVAALSQLLPQLRVCVVQQLRGNSSSLRLLLRGLPMLEVFAVEESPRNLRRQRLLQLASSLGFTVRRGCLTIPALRSSLSLCGNSTISRQFRILSRSPASRRATASSIAAANFLARELLASLTEDSQGVGTQKQLINTSTCNTTADAEATHLVFEGSVAAGTSPSFLETRECSVSRGRPASPAAVASDSMSRRCSNVNLVESEPRMIPFPGCAGNEWLGSCGRISAHALRCSVYGRKRSRDSVCTRSQSPASKRRHRSRSSTGVPTDARQDQQLARTLAEELEEQLTS